MVEQNINNPLISAELLKGILRQNIITIKFIKADGSERIMQCTLDPQYFEKTTKDYTASDEQMKRKTPENIVVVYELNKGFKSFDINRLISYSLNHNT